MEKSKTFRFIGRQVGIKAEKKSQRGIISRRFLESQKIEIPKIELRNIRVNEGERSYWL